jgi:dinuclear metal center YbgI/SA1388 family protein
MLLKDILDQLEKFAPFSLQEDYDNSGIQVGDPNREIKKGLICLDVTESIIDEAIAKGCDLVISHHPIIFDGIKSLSGKNYVERVVIKSIKHDIAILSVHTNLDSIKNGVNGKLSKILGLVNPSILQLGKGLLRKLVTFCPAEHAEKVREAIFYAGAGQIGDYDCCSFNIDGRGTFRGGDTTNPFVGNKGEIHTEPETRIETILPDYLVSKVVKAMISAHPYEEVAYDIYPLENRFEHTGMGMLGELEEPISEIGFLERVKDLLGVPVIRHSELTGKMIKKVALCGGSGSFLKGKAIEAGADAFVTADVKYHDFFYSGSQLLIIDAGHYETEQFTKELLYEILSKKFTNFALLISDQNNNPVRYF